MPPALVFQGRLKALFVRGDATAMGVSPPLAWALDIELEYLAFIEGGRAAAVALGGTLNSSALLAPPGAAGAGGGGAGGAGSAVTSPGGSGGRPSLPMLANPTISAAPSP